MPRQYSWVLTEAYTKKIFKSIFRKFAIGSIVDFGDERHFIAFFMPALQQLLLLVTS